jgi:Sec-independent protein translocase protein TatA
LLVIGPKKLPELARSLGKGLAEFRRASTEMRREFLEVADEARIDPPTQQTPEQPEPPEPPEPPKPPEPPEPPKPPEPPEPPEADPERAGKTKPAAEPKGPEVG